MSQSRVIRYGVLAVIVGIGLLGLRAVPVLLSQEATKPVLVFAQAPAVDPPSVGGATPPQPGAAGGGFAPGGVPVEPVPGAGATGGGFAFEPDPNIVGGGGAPGAAGPGVSPPGTPNAPVYTPLKGPVPAPIGMSGPPGMPGMMGPMMGRRMTAEQMQELQLAQQAKGLLDEYGKEQPAEVKEKLKSDLRALLHQQFRLQQQRREAELQSVEQRLADLRAKLRKRMEAQSTIVDRRLEQLINDIDGLGWNSEDAPLNLFQESALLPPGATPRSTVPAPPRSRPAPTGGAGTGSSSISGGAGVPPGLAPAAFPPPATNPVPVKEPAVPAIPGVTTPPDATGLPQVPGALPPTAPATPPKPTLPESGDTNAAGAGAPDLLPPSTPAPK